MTEARLTKQAAEVLIDADPEARITNQAVEVLINTDPDLRVTKQAIEILVDTDPELRMTQQVIEVLYEPSLGQPMAIGNQLISRVYSGSTPIAAINSGTVETFKAP